MRSTNFYAQSAFAERAARLYHMILVAEGGVQVLGDSYVLGSDQWPIGVSEIYLREPSFGLSVTYTEGSGRVRKVAFSEWVPRADGKLQSHFGIAGIIY